MSTRTKPAIFARAAASLALALALSSCVTSPDTPATTSSASSPVAPAAGSSATTGDSDPATGTGSRPAAAEGPFDVETVTDGDTIKVKIDGESTRIRLIGIDTPEVSDARKPVQCFGREASQRAHELMDGAQVWLEYDPSQGRQDKYGRTLAYVWLDDSVLVNEIMVREGFAHEYTYDAVYKYRDAFRAQEQASSAAQRGLWSPTACAGDTDRPAS